MLFHTLEVHAGTVEGARPLFQLMVLDLVGVRHPTANTVAGPGGGDWGIDTYVGQLDQAVAVWQSKYFTTWKGEDQRGQVRASFNEVVKKSAEQGFAIDAWTLCVPNVLPPDEQQWWDGWVKRMQRKHGIRMALWNGHELRRQLMQPDAAHVLAKLLPDLATQLTPEAVAVAASLDPLSGALFVTQLREAGHVETDAARGLFFAAEALVRDVASRGNSTMTNALHDLHNQVRAEWEMIFNRHSGSAGEDGRMPDLVEAVLRAARNCDDTGGLNLRPSHRMGIAHRLVEDGRAGWVTHWREIAAAHSGAPAGELVAAMLAELSTGGAP